MLLVLTEFSNDKEDAEVEKEWFSESWTTDILGLETHSEDRR
jgi:hypothetical protein